ncbi:MAG: hypothetical protein FWG90_02685 [Oscillospiraceae bacterium]|nr:hypothetical protein [Oscillospiraceae bacterium]
MPKDNRNFFKEKKIWSGVKDELLGCYLVPYFSKVFSMNNPILYIDCFAGKGKFDDGKNGSPLTAIESLQKSISVRKDNTPLPLVNMKFIELNHAGELERNLLTQTFGEYEIINGAFEEKIIPILKKARSEIRNCNVFLYIDPWN